MTMPNRFPIKRLAHIRLPLVALLMATAGCARLGAPLVYGPRPEGAPKLRDLAASLAENDRGIANFRVKGTCTLTARDVKGKDRLDVTIEYRRPDDAYVRASKTVLLVTRSAIARCVGGEFIFVDTDGNVTRGWPEGLVFESIPFASTPADMVREVFLPVDWDSVKPRNLRYEDAGEDSEDLVLILDQDKHFTRRLTIQGPPWIVVRSELIDRRGVVFSSAVLDDYRDHGGIRFPASATAALPVEGIVLALDLKQIALNTELKEDHFTIDERDTP